MVLSCCLASHSTSTRTGCRGLRTAGVGEGGAAVAVGGAAVAVGGAKQSKEFMLKLNFLVGSGQCL